MFGHYDKNLLDAQDAYDEARRSLLDLAAHAIREAFIASPFGLQLALSLTRNGERQRLYDAIPLIVADVRLPWLRDAILNVHEALPVFEKRQHSDADEVAALAAGLTKVHANVAATILRCPRDEGVVILRNVNTRLCVCGVKKRAGKTFAEYETVGALAMGNVRVAVSGLAKALRPTEWEAMP
jgi:hypothetical protein